MLEPPNSIVWNLELALRRKVITGVNHCSRGQQGQKNNRKSDLEIPIHPPRGLRCPQGKIILLAILHFHCHQRTHEATSKMPKSNSFQYYRDSYITRIRFLEYTIWYFVSRCISLS